MSGLLLAMCYPGFEVASSLVWVWAIPLMAALWLGGNDQKRKRFGFKVGGVAGLAFWLVNVKWLLSMDEHPSVPMIGAVAGWLLLSCYLAIYFGVFGAFLAKSANPWRKQQKRELSSIEKKIAEKASEAEKEKPKKRDRGILRSFRVMGFAIMHASLWVVLEWLRGWVLTGFGWNGLGVAFHEVPLMMQIADLVGVAGVSFIPVLLASVMLQTAKRLIDEVRVGKLQAHLEIGLTVGVIAAAFGYGINRMAYHSNQATSDVKVLVIQENISQAQKWDEQLEAEHYMNYTESLHAEMAKIHAANDSKVEKAILSGEEVQLDYPDLLVLPESALTQPIVYTGEKEYYHFPMLSWDFLKEQVYAKEHFKVVFGANVLGGAEVEGEEGLAYDFDKDIYNAFVVTDPSIVREDSSQNEALYVHGKNHLVPFGEYLPEIPFLGDIAEVFSGMSYSNNFSRGGSFEPINLNVRGEKVQLIPSICFEDTVARVNRLFVRREKQMLVNITNDGWFGESEAAAQHMANAKFRTVEFRRPMVRAANTGVSGIVSVIGSLTDPESGELNTIGTPDNPFVKGALFADVKVPEKGVMTLYARHGDWFVVLCALIFVVFTTISLVRRQS